MLVCAQSAKHQQQMEAAGSVLVSGRLHASLSARLHVPDSAAVDLLLSCCLPACLLVCRWVVWA